MIISCKVYNAKLLRVVKSFIEQGEINDMPRDRYGMNELITHTIEKSKRLLNLNFETDRRDRFSQCEGTVHNPTKLHGAALTESIHAMMLSLVKGGANYSYYSGSGIGPVDIEFIAHVVLSRFYVFDSKYNERYRNLISSVTPTENTIKKIGTVR